MRPDDTKTSAPARSNPEMILVVSVGFSVLVAVWLGCTLAGERLGGFWFAASYLSKLALAPAGAMIAARSVMKRIDVKSNRQVENRSATPAGTPGVFSPIPAIK